LKPETPRLTAAYTFGLFRNDDLLGERAHRQTSPNFGGECAHRRILTRKAPMTSFPIAQFPRRHGSFKLTLRETATQISKK
jgi:hypothetical protein